MSLNKSKYEQVVLYLCSKLGKEVRGKKKLAKLLYFIDFDFFEKYGKSITGDIYKALPMGPFPISLEIVSQEMKKRKMLEINNVDEYGVNYRPTEIYRCLKDPNLKVFSREEIKMMDRVIKNYGHLGGTQLEHLTHAEAPYVATEPKKEIAYELAYYRGTDFVDHD